MQYTCPTFIWLLLYFISFYSKRKRNTIYIKYSILEDPLQRNRKTPTTGKTSKTLFASSSLPLISEMEKATQTLWLCEIFCSVLVACWSRACRRGVDRGLGEMFLPKVGGSRGLWLNQVGSSVLLLCLLLLLLPPGRAVASTWSADPPPSATSCSPASAGRSHPQCRPGPGEDQRRNKNKQKGVRRTDDRKKYINLILNPFVLRFDVCGPRDSRGQGACARSDRQQELYVYG